VAEEIVDLHMVEYDNMAKAILRSEQEVSAPQIESRGPQGSRRASRHLQAPQIESGGPQGPRRASRQLQAPQTASHRLPREQTDAASSFA
jgi:hypothetical protein